MVTLKQIKDALGITTDYQDSTIQIYMNETIAYLEDAGVPQSRMTAGIVARGVSDLWNYGAGEGKLSEYFRDRATQLALKR